MDNRLIRHCAFTFLVFCHSPDLFFSPSSKFCVAVSGFKPPDPLATTIMSPSYSTPTLHVIGRNDVVVIEERTRLLLEVSANKRVEEHDGGQYSFPLPMPISLLIPWHTGHFVPSKANWRNFFCDYLNDPLGNVPSPGFSSSSAANSGGNTPISTSAAETHLIMKL
jgi:hypothetical protein